MKRTILLALFVNLAPSLVRADEPKRPPDTPTLEAIHEGWRARQTEIKNGQFEWKEQLTFVRGSEVDLKTPKALNPNRLIIPDGDVTFERRETLKFEGDKVWRRARGKSWAVETGAARDTDEIHAFDGKVMVIFHHPGVDVFPSAVIRKEQYSVDLEDIHTKAVFFALKPLDPRLGLSNNVAVLPKTELIGEVSCCILTRKDSAYLIMDTVWVAIEKGFPIRRWKRTDLNGVLVKQLDISYSKDKQNGMLPIGWNGIWLKDDGTVRRSFVARVDRHQVNLASMSEKEFSHDFPPGTHVTDLRTGQTYIVPHPLDKKK